MSEPLLLSRRLAAPPQSSEPGSGASGRTLLVLALSAAERQRLRGHCRSRCGRDLLLQLPRGGGPLEPGEQLAGADGTPRVQVEAAAEDLHVACSDDPFTLLRAAYHLGNRHVALELRQGELRLLQDPVLAELLRGLGVSVQAITAPFQPEGGAYGTGGHGHSHGHGHGHSHGHSHSHGHGHSDSHSHSDSQGHAHGHGHLHDPSHSHSEDHDPGQARAPERAPAAAQPHEHPH